MQSSREADCGVNMCLRTVGSTCADLTTKRGKLARSTLCYKCFNFRGGELRGGAGGLDAGSRRRLLLVAGVMHGGAIRDFGLRFWQRQTSSVCAR
jgi:hypothetical protein